LRAASALYPGAPITLRYPVQVVVQTEFQSGHLFTLAGGSTGTLTDDVTDFVRGSQSLKLATVGNGGNTAARRTGMTALDATARYLAMEIKVDRPDRLADLRLDVSSDTFTNWSSGDSISPTTNLTAPIFVPNQWTTVILHWGSFAVGGGAGATRSALTGFQVRCKDDGSGPINMWVNRIYSIAEPASAVCTLTFDDGYDGVYLRAKPAMDALGFKGTVCPIVNKMGATNFMTTQQIRELVGQGWDVATHAYDVNIHNAYDTATDAQVLADALSAKAWIRENGLGLGDNLIVPQGQTTTLARLQAWQRYWLTARTNYTRVRETFPPGDKWRLRTYAFTSANSTADIQAKIDEAVANKGWLIMQAHNIVASGATGTDYTTANFTTVVNYMNSVGIKVRTLSEVLATGLV
jgi:peptidoglycan/xylan/chitin deacetylase (PgdA/CDA1 family)